MYAYTPKHLTNNGAKISLGLAFTLRIPFRNIYRANVKVHMGGGAIAQVKLGSPRTKTRLFQIDKARCYNIVCRIDGFFSYDLFFSDINNPTIFDSDIANLIKFAFQVHQMRNNLS